MRAKQKDGMLEYWVKSARFKIEDRITSTRFIALKKQPPESPFAKGE